MTHVPCRLLKEDAGVNSRAHGFLKFLVDIAVAARGMRLNSGQASIKAQPKSIYFLAPGPSHRRVRSLEVHQNFCDHLLFYEVP